MVIVMTMTEITLVTLRQCRESGDLTAGASSTGFAMKAESWTFIKSRPENWSFDVTEHVEG